MNYTEAKQFIFDSASFGSVLGLESIKELLNRLLNPQNNLKFIHIAGTNGKGSVIAYLTSIFNQTEYKVGVYTSPSINSYREVIQVNNKYIGHDAVTRHICTVKSAIDSMLADGLSHPTRFEIETALAFLYFKEQACDIVLLETGLGGSEDATNIVQTTILEVITSISMDHMSILGNTLEKIATKKAGIIKENTSIVSIRQNFIVEEVLNNTASDKECSLIFAQPDKIKVLEYGLEKQIFNYISVSDIEYNNITISLAGVHQFKNAILAIEAVEELTRLGYNISQQQLINGLANTKWKGRFTVIRKKPTVIVDGAHNEDASLKLADSIRLYFKDRRIIYILGIFRDKEFEKIIQHTAKFANKIITVNMPENERLLSSSELTEAVKKYHNTVVESSSLKNAVDTALIEADDDDVIIAFGSLSFLHELEKLF